MSNEKSRFQKEVSKRLESLDANLKLWLNLFKLVNAEKIEEMKQKILKHDLRRQIYELCDGTLTVGQMAEKIGKKPPHVTYHLNILTSAGLLSYRVEGREKHYFKTLE